MAIKRFIKTELAVGGEKEYKQAMRECDAEIRKLKSAVKETESAYQGQANSMVAIQAKISALSNLYAQQEKQLELVSTRIKETQAAEEKYAAAMNATQASIDANKNALSQMDEKTQKAGESWAKHSEDVKKATEQLNRLKSSEDDTSAEQARLNEKIDKGRAEMARLEKSTNGAAKEAGGLVLEINKQNKALSDSEDGFNTAQRDLVKLETDLNNAKTAYNQTNTALKELKQCEEEAAKNNGFATSIDKTGKKIDKTTDSIGALGAVLVAAGVAAAIKKITDAFTDCAEAAIEFEAGMAGVRRTVGGSEKDIDGLADCFKRMSTQIPITTSELTSIAESAGQLGIAQENVESFTEIMAKLGTATDLTAENASTMLAQFANITGLDPADYERLGSTVAALGDATATTASKVVDMSQGMAASASIAGFSETDILALAAAVGSLGIESQAGSTAMSTLISSLYTAVETGSDKLTAFAKVAGMSADEFAAAWKGDAVSALDTFVSGLNDVERNGQSAVVTLSDLGITNVRQTKAILGLSEAEGLLSGTIAQANAAWGENTALTEKSGIMYDTTESKLTMLSNSFDNVKIAIGDALAPAIGTLADVLSYLLGGVEEFIQDNEAIVPLLVGVAVAVGTLTAATLGFIAAVKVLTAVKAAQTAATVTQTAAQVAETAVTVAETGAAAAETAATVTQTAATVARTAATVAQTGATAAETAATVVQTGATAAQAGVTVAATGVTTALGIAMNAIPFIAIASAVVGLTAAVVLLVASYDDGIVKSKDLTKASNDAVDAIDDLNESCSDSVKDVEASAIAAGHYADALDKLTVNGTVSNANQAQYKAIVAELNSLIPDLNATIDNETNAIAGGTEALRENIDAWEDKARQEAYQDILTEKLKKQAEAEIELAENQAKRTTLETELEENEKRRNEILERRVELEAGTRTREQQQEYGDLAGELAELNIEYSNGEKQLAEYSDAVEVSEKNLADLTAEAELTNSVLKNMGGTIGDGVANYDLLSDRERGQVEDLKNLSVELGTLLTVYDDVYDAAYKSFSGQIDLFNQIDNSASTSAEEVIANLQSQIDFMNNYDTNLKALEDRGIEGLDNLFATLADGSEQSGALLAGLVNATDEQVLQVAALMNEAGVTAEASATTVAEAMVGNREEIENTKLEIDGYLEEIDAAVVAMDKSDEAYRAAEQTGQSYVSGLLSKVAAVRHVGEMLGAAVNEGYKKGNEQNSPSKKAIRTAKETAESYAIGLKRGSGALFKAGQDIAQLIYAGFAAGKPGEQSDEEKQRQEVADYVYQTAKDVLETKKYYNKLSLAQEYASLRAMKNAFADYADIRKEISKEIYRVEQEINKAAYDKYKERIDDRIKYEEISVEKQIKLWKKALKQFRKNTDEYKAIQATIKDLRVERKKEKLDAVVNDEHKTAEQKLKTLEKMLAKEKKGSATYKAIAQEIKEAKKQIASTALSNQIKNIVDSEYKTTAQKIANLKKILQTRKDLTAAQKAQIKQEIADLQQQKKKADFTSWLDGVLGSNKTYEQQIAALENRLKADKLSTLKGLTLAQIKEINDAIADLQTKAYEGMYSNQMSMISTRAEYENLTILQQIDLYKTLQKQYGKDAAKRIELEQKIQNLQKQAYDQALALEQKYQDEVKSRADSIMKSWGLLDYADESNYEDIREVTLALESQNARLNEYQEKLAEIQDRGVSGDLLDKIQGYGAGNTSLLDALLRADGDQLAHYLETYADNQRLATELAVEELADLRQETTDQITELIGITVESLKAKGTNTGTSFGEGIVEGIESYIPYLEACLKNLAAVMVSTMQESLDINSPSGVAEDEIGYHFGEGDAKGIEKSTPLAVEAAKDQARAVKDAAAEEMSDIAVQEMAIQFKALEAAQDAIAVSLDPVLYQIPAGMSEITNNAATTNNAINMTINVQKLTDAELERAFAHVDRHYGRKKTISFKGS